MAAARTHPKRLEPEARERFYYAIYAGLGANRSLRAVEQYSRSIEGVGVSLRTLTRYSEQFGWVERAREFDQQKADVQAAAVLESALAQDAQHSQLGRAMQQMAVQGITDYLASRNVAGARKLGGTEIARLGEVGVKLERLASGRVTEITEVMVNLKAVIITGIGDGFLQALEVMEGRLAGAVDPETLDDLRNEMARTYGLSVDRLLTNEFRRVGIVDSEFVEPEA